MYFSLSDYKKRTQNLTVFSRGDATGLYLRWPERWLMTRASRFWRRHFRPRLTQYCETITPLLAVPPPLHPHHVANCKVYSDRNAMIESLDKGKIWAEVGTFEGEFAGRILATCKPAELHVMDLDLTGVRHKGHVTETDVVRFHQGDSAQLLKAYPDAYFDYIYIDAGHDLFAVARDADAAGPKLKKDGLLLFNDYVVYSYLDQLPFGVVQVVNSICNEEKWEMVGLALHHKMYCDVALRRMI